LMAVGLRLIYSFTKGEFEKAMTDMIKPIATTATAAMDAVGTMIKSEGRSNIASAGFSNKWQNALRVDRYPKRGVSSAPALWVFHKIHYAWVFETGATIVGKPTLWIPLPTIPAKLGRKRTTPKMFAQQVGPLFEIRSRRGNRLLMASIKNARKTASGRMSRARLSKGGSQAVPVFVGLSSVKIRKRFGLYAIFQRSAEKLPGLYVSNFQDNR